MVTRKIRCIIIEMPVENESVESESSAEEQSRSRIRDRMHTVDPYIKQLIKKLQTEVRHERDEPRLPSKPRHSRRFSWPGEQDLRHEAPSPLSLPPLEFERPLDDDWPLFREDDED